jgi:Tfp pilus assembly protein PilV
VLPSRTQRAAVPEGCCVLCGRGDVDVDALLCSSSLQPAAPSQPAAINCKSRLSPSPAQVKATSTNQSMYKVCISIKIKRYYQIRYPLP